MDNATCNLIYVDRNILRDGVIHNTDAVNGFVLDPECEILKKNLSILRDAFNDIHPCATGAECISTLSSLHEGSMIDLKPTLVLIDMPFDERIPQQAARSRSPSPHSLPTPEEPSVEEEEPTDIPDDALYGLKLLERLLSEAHLRNLSRLVVPIPVVRPPLLNGFTDHDDPITAPINGKNKQSSWYQPGRRLLRRCLDIGAADVITSPLNLGSLTGLEVQAYRAHKDAAKEQQAMLEVRRGRKRSWVGVNEEKPFAYLREAMVSGLMKGICKLGGDHEHKVTGVQIDVPADRFAKISAAVGDWHFCAHSFSEDELVVAARVMFKHALSMPELERWRISTDQLTSFLIACKAAYNSFVPYHNFRHVIDVLQATFHLLVSIGALRPYPAINGESVIESNKSPMAALIEPFEALTLLITAIGHDVGHPGVNNGFLITLNAPLAQLYNDRSVLESFHCAAYSQILRRYWPTAFEDTKMRNLMISSILATDMGLHFDYMKKLGDTQEKLQVKYSTEGWNLRMIEEQKALACSLIIKCADISNVARKYDTAGKWMYILSDEFSRQASMENELAIPSSLFAPPKKDVISLCESQLNFMNIFAIPLFQGVADLMPALRYTVEELEINKTLFQEKANHVDHLSRRGRFSSEALSPRTMSLAAQDDMAPNKDGATKTPYHEDATDSSSGPTTNSFDTPRGPRGGEDVPDTNGLARPFDPVTGFAASDLFSQEIEPMSSGKQRCSETTEASSSVPCSGDWASQATSATTGKMPISPSTQGTSIVSRDSLDRPPSNTSAPVTAFTSPDTKHIPEPQFVESRSVVETDSGGSTNSPPSPRPHRLIKKKSSIFKINALNFFRRHKSPSPPVPAVPAQLQSNNTAG